ncbi:MAG: DUF2264 domain-containing protein [Opitutaceae bacterium]|jgi:hypothetical protein|nr:DUF2264 domain-containing protein [Opitutaceae bacterium]
MISTSFLSKRSRETAAPSSTGAADRDYWLGMADRIARPVLEAAAAKELKIRMPLERTGANQGLGRDAVAHLEAVGRLVTGIAPWLALELPDRSSPEARLQAEYRRLTRTAIDAITDPASPDYCNYKTHTQPLVDVAFLAQGLLRAPGQLWDPLSDATKVHVIRAFRDTMRVRPGGGNWLLFSAMREAALARFAGDDGWNPEAVDFALREHESYYKGDGVYGDGPLFRWDYYNAFVIQPMILDVLDALGDKGPWVDDGFADRARKRAQRYAAIQERFISPEGAFPPIGRSLAYRVGALQALSQIALRHELPADLKPAQVRCALTAALRRSMEAPGTFDENGWLRIGFCGAQPGVGEGYISTGSLYLCAAVFLPLGLPPEDDFWAGEAADWTSKKYYAGQDVGLDHAMEEPQRPRRRSFLLETK